jgi:uncharacterized protein (DUF58 family)
VPLALTVLGPIIVNILLFHALMSPVGIGLALFVTILWAVVFASVRSAFDGIFEARRHQNNDRSRFQNSNISPAITVFAYRA